MSARAPQGATNRSDLFGSGRADVKENQISNQEEISGTAREKLKQEYGLGGETDDPLQLEHMMGFAGNFKRTVLTIPNNENLYIRSMGNLVAIENLSDPHDQHLLRGHDMQVSALAVSPSGEYVVSGQLGTTHFRGNAAPVFLWSTKTGERLSVLKGLCQCVNLLGFSTDERFVSGCGEDCLFYVWDVGTGEVVYGQRFATPITVLKWLDHRHVHPYVSYELIVGHGTTLAKAMFVYDPNKVQWGLTQHPYLLPPGGGIVRTYTCVDCSPDLDFVYVGTSGGEMLSLMRKTNVFRAIIPICTNSLQTIVALPDGQVVCGGGDGSLNKLVGYDMAWRYSGQTTVESGILSVSLSANHREVIFGCITGTIYRAMTEDFKKTIVAESHTSPVRCLSFFKGNGATMFAAGTNSGEIRVWDIVDYACVSILRLPKVGEVLCLHVVDDTRLLSGWSDGSVRCHSLPDLSKQLWYLPTAHRNGTFAISAFIGEPSGAFNNLRYFVSGGGEGCVRIWGMDTRELITQHSEHQKRVSQVLVDVRAPNLIHSVGVDCSVLSFDLKSNRRIMSHLSAGCMNSMTQRKDSEQELITCDAQGRLLHWDIDYREPVLCMQDPSRVAINSVQVSPSGKFVAFAGEDQLLKIVQLSTGHVVSLGQGHSGAVRTLHWTPDEKQIVTGGEDCSLCVWNFFLS